MKHVILLTIFYILFLVCNSHAQYCASFNSGGSACITQVSFNTINNTTTGCASGNYSQQTATTNLLVGNSYNLTVTLASNGNAAVWLDFNHNTQLEASEWFQVIANGTTGTVSITVPTSAAYGIVGMRVRSAITAYPLGANDACTTVFTGETEDYNLTVLPGVNYDPAIATLNTPTGNCFSALMPIGIVLTNYGLLPINLSINPVTVYLYVNGPNGLTTYSVVVSNGVLQCCGANMISVVMPNVNLYNGGLYVLNTSLSIVNSGGVSNPVLSDDSLSPPIQLVNKRPVPASPYVLCQGASIPFGQGLSVSGCSTPLFGTATITFTVTPCMDNVGATLPGNSIGLPANCSNQYACTFASGTLPALPPGASFTQPGTLTITNLYSAFPDECRFNLFGSNPNGPGLFSSCPTPYNVGANDIDAGGLTVGTQASFSYVRKITTNSLSAIYSNLLPGDILHVGYFESWNDTAFQPDCLANALAVPTTVTLTIPYTYTPASIEWYDVPVGGTSLFNLSPFNPLSVPNTVVNNSSTPGTYIFYAACSGTSTCRTKDTLQIVPSPLAFQDTIISCENAVGSNTAVFDLTTLNGGISGGNPYDSIRFYYDQALVSPIQFPMNDTTGSVIHFSKMYLGACYSSDTVLVQVNSLPDIQMLTMNGTVCAPNSIDITSLINPFSTFPPGTDTLFFQDAACTLPHPNPHNITSSDSIYIVASTNAVPSCTDTALTTIDIGGTDSLLVNQNAFNISDCSALYPIPAVTHVLTDGNASEYQNPFDCRRITSIVDVTNGTSLGSTTVETEIDCTTLSYQGQLYLKRHFTVNASNQTAANLCLYVLQDDIDEFNNDATNVAQPTFTPTLSNLCITKIDNGNLTDPLHTYSVIPNNLISKSYDAAHTIWTLCFPVDSFSSFYCHTCNAFNAALWLELKEFTARKQQQQVLIQWRTAQETNSDYFVVEKSNDGVHFIPCSERIASKALNDTSKQELNYQFIDKYPFKQRNFYRLVHTDNDGKQQYSAIREVIFEEDVHVTIYPNPAKEFLKINLDIAHDASVKLELSDASGRQIRLENHNMTAGSHILTMSTKEVVSGLYQLKVIANNIPVWIEKLTLLNE